MAIKYGRPIEARVAPVEKKPKARLDLTSRPRKFLENGPDGVGSDDR